jgi:hypothetical protein
MIDLAVGRVRGAGVSSYGSGGPELRSVELAVNVFLRLF